MRHRRQRPRGAARTRPSASVQPRQQVCQPDAEDLGDPPEVDEGDVALAALHEADVRLVQFAAPRKLGLRPPQAFAPGAEAVPDLPEEFFVAEVHWLDANDPLSETTLT